MKITAIKSNKSTEFLATQLFNKLRHLGFDCQVNVVNTSRIDIKGPHGKNGPARFEPNYNITRSTKSGLRKCYQPTWDQYVTLNNAINDVLDAHKTSATVKSTGFNIRDKHTGRFGYWEKPSYMIQNESNGFGPVLTKQEAIELELLAKEAA